MFPPAKKPTPKSIFRRTPPPNYQLRSVKLKLFAIVAAVMAGLFVLAESRQEKPWQWFHAPAPEIELNDRLLTPLSPTAHDPPGTIVQPISQTTPSQDDMWKERGLEEQAWVQGWSECYDSLKPNERTLLCELLAQCRGEHPLATNARGQAGPLVQKLADQWEAYADSAQQSLVGLQPAERATWEEMLRTLNERWRKQTQPALLAAANGETTTGDLRRAADEFQRALDRINLSLVQDDTPLRAEENELWFRLMSRSKHTPAGELAGQSQSDVTYLELFEQPAHFRGQLVTIKGIVRTAWKSTAIRNPWGLEHFYVLWIHPSDGPNAPYIAHVSELPAGFPEIKERGPDGKLPKLHADVTVHAYFFKRQAYPSADGPRTAPLLLAHTLEWEPPVTKSQSEFTTTEFLTIIAGTLVVSSLAAVFIYRRIRNEDRRHVHDVEIAAADLSALQGVEVTPSAAAGLKQLEQDFGRNG